MAVSASHIESLISRITEIILQDIILPANANTSATRYMGVESFFQYAYACSGTQAAFMDFGGNFTVGIALNNVEVGA